MVGGTAPENNSLKIICDIDREYQGSLKVNPSLHMGYFAQELEVLDHQASILDNVLTEQISVQEARILLANLLFPG